MPNPLVAALGYPADARLVIFHADDVGMCHGSNQAFLALAQAGLVQSGSLMLPCPWAPEMLAACRANPALDVGIHLTLTSEWDRYRWGPSTTRDPVSGLLDDEGCFWRRTAQVQEHMDVTAAAHELRGQIAAGQRAGLDFTHLDTHMAAALLPELLPTYIELGFSHRVPVLLPRRIDEYVRSLSLPMPEESAYQRLVQSVEARGMPLVDWFRITPGYDAPDNEGGRREYYEAMLTELPPGVTFFSLHPNAPGDIETIVPDRAHWRTFEYELFQSDWLRSLLARERIIPIGLRAMRAVMRGDATLHLP